MLLPLSDFLISTAPFFLVDTQWHVIAGDLITEFAPGTFFRNRDSQLLASLFNSPGQNTISRAKRGHFHFQQAPRATKKPNQTVDADEEFLAIPVSTSGPAQLLGRALGPCRVIRRGKGNIPRPPGAAFRRLGSAHGTGVNGRRDH
jgi:hypothetical protein